MREENRDKKRIREFILQGNNDVYGYSKRMKQNPEAFKEKVTYALLSGPDNEINRYTRYLEAALASFVTNEENVTLITRKITDDDPSHSRNWVFNERERLIFEEFNKKIDVENVKIDIFFQQLPIVLLKNDEYIDCIAKQLEKTNAEVKNLIIDHEIKREILPFIEKYNLDQHYSNSLVGNMGKLNLRDVESGLTKYLNDESTTNKSIYINRLSGDVLAYIVSHVKDTLHKMMLLYPEANHWLIKLFKEHEKNPKLDRLKTGIFTVSYDR